jgi:murein L,D-transpeptidase YcbB/YkuD
VFAAAGAAASGQGERGVAVALRERIEGARSGAAEVRGIPLGAAQVLAEFYTGRGFEPAWGDPARVRELLDLLLAAPEHGLDQSDFFLDQLQSLAGQAGTDASQSAERDLLLTEALVRYGYQRRFGKVDPETLEPAWNFGRGFANEADAATVLAEAVAAPSLAEYLGQKLAPGPWYRQLQASLARYRAIVAAGGWPEMPAGPALRAGDRALRVVTLRERLRIEGDLAPGEEVAEPELFDEGLAAAVRAFQGRHSLATDGVVGAGTLAALNVPAASRVEQIRMSLERVRWLAGAAPDTYVVVNVAGFRVGFVRERRLIWSSRVVVGRAARQTPVFRGEMTYVELNPTWTVPPTILREDVLPKVRKDPGYLRRENITVLDRDGRRVDPSSVNWSTAGRAYTLRQEPGPANALGRIKLMFPNPHAVYLHDTPATELFERPERTFSSGCIRVEDPLALAELVLDSPAWSRARLEAEIANGTTQRINLPRPVPVLLVYLTAVADSDGTTRFYRDVYDRDPPLLRAMYGPVRLRLPKAAGVGPAEKMGPVPL